MSEQSPDAVYHGQTLKQHRERIRKLAEDRGLTGDKLERVIEQAVELIPTIKVNLNRRAIVTLDDDGDDEE